MRSTNKLIAKATILAVVLCTLTHLSAMESPEQRAEEIRLDQPRQQQKQQQIKPFNQALVNKFEALESLQEQQRLKKIQPNQLKVLKKLEQEFENFSPQQLQQLRQQVQQKQNKIQQKKLKKQQFAQKNLTQSQNQPHPFNVYVQQAQQSVPSVQSAQLRQSQLNSPKQPTVQKQASFHNTWISSAGLVYASTDKIPNRINHVLSHAKIDLTKPQHTVFSVPEYRILDLVDEAWSNRGNPVMHPKFKGDNYIIDMDRVIGTKGETKMLIVSKGKSNLITAYPVS